eukprot:CAMPEP_0179173018 /NCGR_PEP_ID=MMETSP0796-20121207/85360_1 /TAXON_ID=73915 /ORGANISM="Pyrodinium bahamense, Strain pbaha01" /LENGTH=60 /DNA_ID=CAMNT_0020876209 /DNA_START=58 /DNA_END=240 /DNA_ORIENTATION=+
MPKTEIAAPNLLKPLSDKDEPKRKLLRRDNDAPTTGKSSTDNAAPSLHMPRSDTEEPKLA